MQRTMKLEGKDGAGNAYALEITPESATLSCSALTPVLAGSLMQDLQTYIDTAKRPVRARARKEPAPPVPGKLGGESP